MKIGRQAGREMESSGKPRPASPCECSLPTRHSLALTPTDPAEEATTFLIANPRLKFSLNHRKHSHPQISNREPMRVFQLLPTHHSPEPLTCPETDHGRRRVTAFLIGNETGKSASLVIMLFDRNILCPRPVNQRSPRRSTAQPHLIPGSRITCNTRRSRRSTHGHRSNAKSF